MPWFRVDDGFASHPKALATSLAARGLWVTAGSWSSAHLTDGVVPDHVLAALGGTPELAAELVAAGLWRRRRGAWVFHEFLSKNPSRAQVERERASSTRRQALSRDPALKQAVRDRDGGACRYCGRTVRWGKGRAADSGTYDHVDPAGPNTLANLVVACVACNSSKQDRTLEETGMRLIPAPQKVSRNASGEGSREGTPTRPDPEGRGRPYGRSPNPPSANGRASPQAGAADPPKPPWCGRCDERTRHTGDPPGRCPTCHPLASGFEADAWRAAHAEDVTP